MATLPANNLDYAWDRAETAETVRLKLAGEPTPEWLRTAAWLMREARTDEVWQFLTLRQVADSFPQLRPMLGRRRQLWEYLLRAAHELGRLYACTPLKRDFLRLWFAQEPGVSHKGDAHKSLESEPRISQMNTDKQAGVEVLQQNFMRSCPRISKSSRRSWFLSVIICEIRGRKSFPFPCIGTLAQKQRFFLEQAGHDILAAIPDAKAKDGGWDPAVVSMRLDGLDATELRPWLLRNLTLGELQNFLNRLRLAIAVQALPESGR